jgi:hypothetical protein
MCAATSSPAKSSSTWPMPRPAPKPGAPIRPGSVSTAPPARARRWCSPNPRPPSCCPRPPRSTRFYAQVKVHRDYHVQIGKALYSIPEHLRGQTLSVRADGELVKMFHRGQLVKTHPRQPAGGRSTDPADLPAEKTGYAMRDLTRLIGTAAGHGPDIGIYAERLLDHDLPWTRMRQVYRLLGLVKRYGAAPVDTACGRALELDVVSVTKIAAMLEKATENASPSRRGRRRGWPRRGSPATRVNTAPPRPGPNRTG